MHKSFSADLGKLFCENEEWAMKLWVKLGENRKRTLCPPEHNILWMKIFSCYSIILMRTSPSPSLRHKIFSKGFDCSVTYVAVSGASCFQYNQELLFCIYLYLFFLQRNELRKLYKISLIYSWKLLSSLYFLINIALDSYGISCKLSY